MNRSRFLDIHILHMVGAANLNRDEAQEPKTIQLGGSTRAMVSSQAWKRPVGLVMEDVLGEYSARTRMVPPVVAERLRQLGWPEDLAAFAAAQVARSAGPKGLKTNPQQGHRTQAMLLLSVDAVDEIVALCVSHRLALEAAFAKAADSKDPAAPVLPTGQVSEQLVRRTATISLLGRMLAELPGGHVEAAVQMAPAFTVNTADPQPDFFTTVEHWPAPGERGSAHLQTAFLVSGVFYRYTTVNITDLLHNLHDLDGREIEARDLIALFARSFITAMPQAKKTSTAPHTLPDLVHYVVRDRRPVSYAAAFDRPVKAAPGGGHTEPARQTLADYARRVDRLIGTADRVAHGHTGAFDQPLQPLGTFHDSFHDLADACAKAALDPTDPDDAPRREVGAA